MADRSCFEILLIWGGQEMKVNPMANLPAPQDVVARPHSSSRVGLDEALPLVYEELYRLACGYMSRERDGHTLQPTALVNEAYLRLVGQHSLDFNNRAQILGVAAQMMRRILSTHHEKRVAAKRGDEFCMVRLGDATEPAAPNNILFSEVNEVLDKLAALDERQAKVAELRIFGGLTAEEIAEYLSVSLATVRRDWASGKLWLARELKSPFPLT